MARSSVRLAEFSGPYVVERVGEVAHVVREVELLARGLPVTQARLLAIQLNRAFEDGYRAGLADGVRLSKAKP